MKLTTSICLALGLALPPLALAQGDGSTLRSAKVAIDAAKGPPGHHWYLAGVAQNAMMAVDADRIEPGDGDNLRRVKTVMMFAQPSLLDDQVYDFMVTYVEVDCSVDYRQRAVAASGYARNEGRWNQIFMSLDGGPWFVRSQRPYDTVWSWACGKETPALALPDNMGFVGMFFLYQELLAEKKGSAP